MNKTLKIMFLIVSISSTAQAGSELNRSLASDSSDPSIIENRCETIAKLFGVYKRNSFFSDCIAENQLHDEQTIQYKYSNKMYLDLLKRKAQADKLIVDKELLYELAQLSESWVSVNDYYSYLELNNINYDYDAAVEDQMRYLIQYEDNYKGLKGVNFKYSKKNIVIKN